MNATATKHDPKVVSQSERLRLAASSWLKKRS